MLPSNKFLRFCIVGAINTLIDVPLFLALYNSGMDVLSANIISTSAALVASLILNYKFTFRGRSLTRNSIAIYFLVTLSGIWILQPAVITAILSLGIVGGLIAKLASLGFSLVWNYLWYSRVVFKDKT